MNESNDWARIVDGKVEAIIVWDGATPYPNSEGLINIPYVEREMDGGGTEVVRSAEVGFDYVDGEFVDNRPKPEDLDA